jgi:hypothetical protein
MELSLVLGGVPGTQWNGGRVGPRADLDAVKERKLLSLLGIEQRFQSRQAHISLLI